MDRVSITTVIPAYNEGERLAGFLAEWAEAGLRCRSVAATAIVVDDGSREESAALQQMAAARADERLRGSGASHTVQYVRADRNRGKGAAIRLGWSRAAEACDWWTFVDADGAIPAREYWRVVEMLASIDADAVCGSRVKMAGRTVERSLFRHLQGRTFATIVEELFHLGFYDTQCGMKFFRASVMRPWLPILREDRWLLDVELLARLRQARARCVEVPVDCHMEGGSSLVVGLDPLRMIARLFRLRARLKRDAGAGR